MGSLYFVPFAICRYAYPSIKKLADMVGSVIDHFR